MWSLRWQHNRSRSKLDIKLVNITVVYLSRHTGKSPSKGFPTSPSVRLFVYNQISLQLSFVTFYGIAPSTQEIATSFHSYYREILSD